MTENTRATTCPTPGCVQRLRPPNYVSHAPNPCVELADCPTCKGTGMEQGERCDPCSGYGTTYQPSHSRGNDMEPITTTADMLCGMFQRTEIDADWGEGWFWIIAVEWNDEGWWDISTPQGSFGLEPELVVCIRVRK